MEAKKNPSADLNRMSGLFLSIGFTVSTLIVITAFEWSQESDMVDLTGLDQSSFDEAIKVPVSRIDPPIPPAPRPLLVPVSTKEEVKGPVPIIDIESTDSTTVTPIEIVPIEPETETDVPYRIVEESASPVGGFQVFYAFVAKALTGKYPSQAKRMQIEGRVFIEFIVERDGTLTNVISIKGIGGGCDELAVAVVAGSPKWNPGRQRGKAVRQRYTLPITFVLN